MNELQELLGEKIRGESHLEDSVKKLIQNKTSEVMVVSLAAAGALMVSWEVQYRVRAPVVPIRSRVGAEDSIVAGMVMGLALGHSLREALYFGVAAGSAAVMTPGSELCRRKDTRNLFDQMVKNNKEKEK